MSAIDDLQANAAQPFEQARAMPPSVYTDPAFLQAELSNIFSQDWFCVGRADALINEGDYLTLDLAVIIGKRLQDLAVLRVAYAFEQATETWKTQPNICLS